MDRQIATREKPYGLTIVPDREQFEYIDPQNEEVTEARWRPVLERLGIQVLGIRDVLPLRRITVDGIEWELELIEAGRECRVPTSVYHRIRSAEAEGIEFAYWIWGEEQFPRPKFQPIQETPLAYTPPRKVDPLVIGVIPTAPNRGIWCLLGRWLH